MGITGSLIGDTIIPWKGAPITNATIVRIKDGHLYYATDSKKGKLKLLNIRSIDFDFERAATKGPSQGVIRTFEPYTYAGNRGYLLTISIRDKRPRIPEPLIRVFTLEENERGVRKLKVHRNRSTKDPTRIVDVEIIDSKGYVKRSYFVAASKALAHRIEIWVDGELLVHQSEAAPQLSNHWWRRLATTKSLTLKAIDDEVQTAQKKTPYRGEIQACRVFDEMGKETLSVTFDYTIHATPGKRIKLPKATMYVLTENVDGARKVSTVRAEPSAGNEIAVDRRIISRRNRFSLAKNVVMAKPNFGDAGNYERLLFWRVELLHGKQTLDVETGGNPRIGASLRKGWWKEGQ